MRHVDPLALFLAHYPPPPAKVIREAGRARDRLDGPDLPLRDRLAWVEHAAIAVVASSFLFAGMGIIAYICVRTWRPGSGLLRLRPRSTDSGGVPASDWT